MHLNQHNPTELTRLQELIEGKRMKKPMKESSTRSGRKPTNVSTKSKPNPGDPEGEIAEIIVLEQRMEGSQTVIMMQLHKEPTSAFVSQEELIVSLVPHVDGLEGTLKELKDDLEHLKDMRQELRCIKYDITKLKR
jgi:hypothetical protein